MTYAIAVKTEMVKVQKVSLELTEADIAGIVADPAGFARQLKRLVNGRAKGGGKARPEKSRRKKAAKRRADPNGRKPRQSPPAPPPANGAKPIAMTTCPECGQRLAAKYLNLHLKKKHPPAIPSSSAPDADA